MITFTNNTKITLLAKDAQSRAVIVRPNYIAPSEILHAAESYITRRMYCHDALAVSSQHFDSEVLLVVSRLAFSLRHSTNTENSHLMRKLPKL